MKDILIEKLKIVLEKQQHQSISNEWLIYYKGQYDLLFDLLHEIGYSMDDINGFIAA